MVLLFSVLLILIVSQTNLNLMLVVLAVVLMGVGFGLVAKNKERLLMHRWTMTIAIILTSVAIFFVMLPSAYNFFIDPNLQFPSSLSFITLIHAILGIPTITLGLIYTLGDLPQKVKVAMRWTLALWLGSLVLGVVLFLESMGYLPF